MTYYFAYGTLKGGFPNHEAFADVLGAPVGEFRTVVPYPLVVPHRPACANPGCRYVHRMGVLLDDAGSGERVEGEVYDVEAVAFDRLDALESYRRGDEAGSTYLRRLVAVEPVEGGDEVEAHVYFVADAEPWRAMLERREADTLSRYTLDLATGPLKPCCRRDPEHAGPHDVVS